LHALSIERMQCNSPEERDGHEIAFWELAQDDPSGFNISVDLYHCLQ
jgi:hypothetical protein